MTETDLELLKCYTRDRAEDAFAELVRRHLDLVHSAALRQVGSPQLAEEVAQSVFTDLARNAHRLAPDTILTAWLYQVTRRTAIDVVRREARRQLREQIATEMNAMNATTADWTHIEPLLDEAMHALDDTDRAAVLLRYFENKSLREVGTTLGTSDDAAQKRVSRAVERLREFFAKRGVTVGASGLVAVISANAVQAAPVGLAVTISTAAALGGTTIVTTATATAVKTIAMTTMQKALVTATVAVLAGTGIYEARQASQLRSQVQTLQQQQAPLTEQIQKLHNEREEATNTIARLKEELAKNQTSNAELLKLRGEIGVLRTQLADAGNAKAKSEQPPLSSAIEYYRRAERHRSENEYEAQFEDLNKAIELDPNLADAYKDRASLYAHTLPKSRGGETKAVADYTRYLELKPRDASIRHNRGLYYEHLGQIDNAISDYTMVIEGDLDFEQQLEGKNKLVALDYLYRGRIYQWRKRDYSQAIADYTAALALDPQREGAHRLRGQCYEILGESEKAQQDFAIEPKNN